jgi:hypothetical protein
MPIRVSVVRTPGELRDTIGHKVMVRKDWTGVVVDELLGDRLSEAGFHPKRQEKVYLVQFDQWEQPIAVPATNMVLTEEPDEEGS